MKTALAAVLALIVHAALAVLVRPYGDAVTAIGSWVTRANDIADIPRQFGIGLVLTGAVVAVGVAVTAAVISKTDPA